MIRNGMSKVVPIVDNVCQKESLGRGYWYSHAVERRRSGVRWEVGDLGKRDMAVRVADNARGHSADLKDEFVTII